MRFRVLSVAVIVLSLAVIAPASGSELVQDPNAALLSLGEREGRGPAHLPPRRRPPPTRARVGRGQRSSAVGGDPASAVSLGLRGRLGEVPQREVLEHVQEPLPPVRRAVAPDARRRLQGAERQLLDAAGLAARLPLLGFDPLLPHHTNMELHLAHFSGELPKLEAYPNWTYGGRWQGLFGRYTYLGQPIYGFGPNAKGVPKDKYGRNLYIDTLNSAYGPGWKRESGILTHKGTGTFCHSFVPQKPFAGYPTRDVRPPAAGERHRITVGGTWRAADHAGGGPGPDEGRRAARRRVQRALRSGHGRRQDLRPGAIVSPRSRRS